MVANLARGMLRHERHADRLDAELVERAQLERAGHDRPRAAGRVAARPGAREPGWCCRSRSRTAARRGAARSSARARARCSRRSRPARSSGSRPGCASRATRGSRRATSGTSSGGRMLVNRLPGPATMTSARGSASQTSGTQRGRSGSSDTRAMRPPAARDRRLAAQHAAVLELGDQRHELARRRQHGAARADAPAPRSPPRAGSRWSRRRAPSAPGCRSRGRSGRRRRRTGTGRCRR